MDIYEYLKKDHKKVASLFELFEKTENFTYQLAIFSYLHEELVLHAESEQATFYQALKNFPSCQQDEKQAEQEHVEIIAKLNLLAADPSTSAEWKKNVMDLKKVVDHHVSEEEGKIFSEAKKVLTKEQAWILKEKMHDFKDKIRMNAYDVSELLAEEDERYVE